MTYIVIEGVIGIGKTALTRLLGEQFGMPTFFEQFEENPFLGHFYTDRESYAFQTEVFFLLNRYRQQGSIVKPAQSAGNLVGDYLFAKTRLFAGLNLRGAELELFDQIYDALAALVPSPDLVVFLTASVDTLMARIYQRDRTIERKMERAYIADLSGLYNSFFSSYSGAPVIRVDTDGLDFIRDSSVQQEMIDSILHAAGVEGLQSS
ncbi:MAG: deoxynucleoside kinase [Chloroflexota bacterium]|nr:deoxynucleoside kinase [Chloroflexota bacterium]